MVSVAESVGFGTARRSPGKRSDEINAGPGDSLWYVRIVPKPRVGMRLRARLFFPGGWATFESPEDAEDYLTGQSEGVEEAARSYLEWARGEVRDVS